MVWHVAELDRLIGLVRLAAIAIGCSLEHSWPLYGVRIVLRIGYVMGMGRGESTMAMSVIPSPIVATITIWLSK